MSEKFANEPRRVEILREPVELYKVLKFEGLLASGGEAKAAIDAGQVQVNGMPELQRRKKLKAGDVIQFGDEALVLALAEGVPTAAEHTASHAKQSIDPAKDPAKEAVVNSAKNRKDALRGRRKKPKPAEKNTGAGILRGRGKLPV